MREYVSIYHHGILKGGLRAMSSRVYQVRLCINVSFVSAEWHEQVGFLNNFGWMLQSGRGEVSPLV